MWPNWELHQATSSYQPGFKPRTSLPCDGSVHVCHHQVKKCDYLMDLKNRVSGSEDWFSPRVAKEISMKRHGIFPNILPLKLTVEGYLLWLDAPELLREFMAQLISQFEWPNSIWRRSTLNIKWQSEARGNYKAAIVVRYDQFELLIRCEILFELVAILCQRAVTWLL